MPKVTDFLGRPHSGLVPHAVVGLVVDNVDPDELGRIKVKFPTLHEEPESFWLRQATPNGGKERGFYALPEIGDEVLVLFMQGSQDVGVIIGQFWNGEDIPPKECKDALPGAGKTDCGAGLSKDKLTDGSKDLADNDRRFWKSRSGHLFVFDDTGGSESVQIWDKSHTLSLAFDTSEKLITLANTGGDIHIRADKDIVIDAGKNIKFEAGDNVEGEAGKDIEIEAGMNWKMEAGMAAENKSGTDFKIEAGTGFEAKGGTTAKVEGGISFTGKGGAQATLEGGAMTTVKGGMVMIN